MNAKRVLVGLLAALCLSTVSAHRPDDLDRAIEAVIIGGIVYNAVTPREREVIIVEPPRYVRPYIEDCDMYRLTVQYRNCIRRNSVEQYRADQENESRYQRSLQSGHYRYEDQRR